MKMDDEEKPARHPAVMGKIADFMSREMTPLLESLEITKVTQWK